MLRFFFSNSSQINSSHFTDIQYVYLNIHLPNLFGDPVSLGLGLVLGRCLLLLIVAHSLAVLRLHHTAPVGVLEVVHLFVCGGELVVTIGSLHHSFVSCDLHYLCVCVCMYVQCVLCVFARDVDF